MQNFYITTPIYYVNDKPHIGHAYTSLAADILTRFLELDGANPRFTTGTDEHGQKILNSAKKSNINPQDFVNNVSENFKLLAETMNFKYSDFIRTTEDRHKKAVKFLWDRLKENNFIYLSKYSGWYSERDEAFYAEDELVDGKAPTGADVQWLEEESYFFKLSAFQDKLLDFYNKNPDFIQPQGKFNEVVSFVKSGLKDLSVSRLSLSWGIHVPGDEKHTIYVWLDALTNYLSSVGYPNEKSELYKNFWENGRIIHIIGKDILRFHAVYWPAFLIAANLPLPTVIFAHGWWTNEGEKISKSLGNVIDPIKLVTEFNTDYVRYFLMREIPFGNDGNFSIINLKKRVNGELSNNVGNLVQRSLTLIVKNYDGIIPQCEESDAGSYAVDSLDDFVLLIYKTVNEIRTDIKSLRFSYALEKIMALSSNANEYVNLHEPWKLKNNDNPNDDNSKKLSRVLYNLAEAIRCIGIMLQPFIPDLAARVLDLIKIPLDRRQIINVSEEFRIRSGVKIDKPSPIFPRFTETR